MEKGRGEIGNGTGLCNPHLDPPPISCRAWSTPPLLPARLIGRSLPAVNVRLPLFCLLAALLVSCESTAPTPEQLDALEQRVGQVEEIAKTASFLLSDGAGYITGQNIRVDGGITRHV